MYRVSSLSPKYAAQEVTRVRPKLDGSWRYFFFQGDRGYHICFFFFNELKGYIDFFGGEFSAELIINSENKQLLKMTVVQGKQLCK